MVTFLQSITQNNEWLVVGDFNQVLSVNDKLSSKKMYTKGTDLFMDCLNQCSLSEIPSQGQFMTWTNNRDGEDVVWERLDRGFANSQWLV